MDKLAVLQQTVPLKAIINVDEILESVFAERITDLLSLKADSARALVQSLPAVKKHCWGMGFKEMMDMFTKYADGELEIKPRSNYFDRVLVGQIVESYKKENRKKVVKKIDEVEYKSDFDTYNTIIAFDQYVQEGKIDWAFYWIFDYLEFKNVVKFTNKQKQQKWDVTKTLAKDKNTRTELTKKMLVEDYFGRLVSKEQHIKDLL